MLKRAVLAVTPRRLDGATTMETRSSKRNGSGSVDDIVTAGAVWAAGAGGSAAAVLLGGGGGGGQSSDGPPEHLSPGYGAGYDAGFQAGLLAASQGHAPPPAPGPGAVAAVGGVCASAPEPERPPFLALLEDFPDLFQKEVLERLDRGEALGTTACRRQRRGAAGRHRGVLPVPLDVRLGRGEWLPVAT